jgi:hypothetical protein
MCRPPVLEEETTEKELAEQSRRSRCERNGRLNRAGLRVSKIGGERAGGEKRERTVGHPRSPGTGTGTGTSHRNRYTTRAAEIHGRLYIIRK